MNLLSLFKRLGKNNYIKMKKVSLILSAVVMTAMMLRSCGDASNEVTIGKQVWMTQNLNVNKFRNGDPIPQAKTQAEWEAAGKNNQPAWCYYDNDPANGEIYGKLYNWYAVNDQRGLAPEGWKIPSDQDWTTLADFWDEDVAGTKMKSKSGNGNNSNGFPGLMAGCRLFNGVFINNSSYWWSSTDAQRCCTWIHQHYNGNVRRDNYGKEYGLSVRCLRD